MNGVSTQDVKLLSPSGASASALLLTALGEFFASHHDFCFASDLVEVLATVGIEEKSARQAIFRAIKDGYMISTRVGRRSQLMLTERALNLLEVGRERIFSFQSRSLSDRWLIVAHPNLSIERQSRRRLMIALRFYGLVSPYSGLFVGTNPHFCEIVMDIFAEYAPDSQVIVATVSPDEVVGISDMVMEMIDLDVLEKSYGAFIDYFTTLSEADQYVGQILSLVHEWRHFAIEDIELFDSLLPIDWIGRRGKELFDSLYNKWRPLCPEFTSFR
ncbi:MAG: hypothetical protein M0019_02725 [Actinomycetota bacterium]|nr:hypothetical protein [Actinomycetota bacterium]